MPRFAPKPVNVADVCRDNEQLIRALLAERHTWMPGTYGRKATHISIVMKVRGLRAWRSMLAAERRGRATTLSATIIRAARAARARGAVEVTAADLREAARLERGGR